MELSTPDQILQTTVCMNSDKPGLGNFSGGSGNQIPWRVEYSPDHKGEYEAQRSSSLLHLVEKRQVRKGLNLFSIQ